MTEEGAFEHIDELARLYLGVDKYPFHQEGDVRVIFKVVPTRVATIESTMPDLSASTRARLLLIARQLRAVPRAQGAWGQDIAVMWIRGHVAPGVVRAVVR
jgi:hypothetical protein